MHEKRFLNIKVNCPGGPLRTLEKMQITQAKMENGWFPLPCNGCDSMNGTMPCEYCCAAITLMFFHAPNLDISKPITPALPQKDQ